jgi:hypothetical protein
MWSIKAIRYSGPSFGDLDAEGRRLYLRACDLSARFWLNDAALPEFDLGNFEGCAMLIHAERYLADRFTYELFPWPKGKLKVESAD